MEHVGLRTRLKAGCEQAYIRAHEEIWPEVLANLRAVGVHRYLIYRDRLELFHAIECDDWDAAVAQLAKDPVDQRWQAAMAELTDVSADLSGEGRDRLELIFGFDADEGDAPA
jgi:L-rhamnose mutarotase